MRRGALLAACLALGAPRLASAQVSVDQRALDGLQAPAPQRPATPRPAPRPAPPRPAPRTGQRASQSPVRPAAPPQVPVAPPPVAVVPPPLVVPVPRPVPPPPIPVVADAQGEASRIPGGLRITFGSGSSDLNQATEAALRDVGRQLKANEAAVVNVFAYAPGQPEDPSTPRRISLSRALAARAVLISEGVASPRMIVRAEGSHIPDGPADRVDIVLVGTPQPAPPASAISSPAASPPAVPSAPR